MFSLKLFGGAVIEGPDGPLSGRLAQRRRVALLAVLAVARQRPVTRDRLVGIFWPDSDTERARHSLADALYQLRRDLGESAVLTNGDDLRLNPEVVASDVSAFEEALEADDLHAAVASYAGPFLEGFHLGDAAEFERWLDAERERFARAHLKALERLAESATAADDVAAAVDWWRRTAAGDPYDGRVTLRLMLALEAAGNRAGALQQARVHAALLQDEFGAEPHPEVVALADRLRRKADSPPPPAGEARTAAPGPPLGADDATRGPGGEDRPSSVDAPPLFPRAESATPRKAPTPTHRFRRWSTAAVVVGAALAGTLLFRSLRTDASVGAAAPSPSPDGISAIAVLPCDDLGGEPSEAYFSDGLTEELIATLSQVQALRVVARTSVFALEGEPLDVREVGRRLNAGTVVECSVRRAGDRFRVTAQLVDAGDGYHLWAQTYEREGTDLFAIQNDLAMRIASALEAELSPSERARLTHPATTRPDAHVLYLRGRFFWNQRTPDALARAIDYFQQAIAIDSQYATAYAGLARAYALQGVIEAIPPQQANDRMRAAALRAVALDGDLAAAHAEMGSYLNVYAWDTDAAEREYRRAIDLDPSDSNTRHMYGNLLRSAGRYDEAVEQKRRATMLDPLSPQIFISLGLTLLAAGRQDEAYDTFRQAVELDSMYWSGHAGLGAFYSATGRHDEALDAYRRALRISGGNNNARAGLAQALAVAGRKDEAKRLLAEVRAEVDRTGVHSPSAAFALLAVDDVDGALAWLETAHDQRNPQLRIIDFPSDPRLVNDARFADLARRIGRPNLAQPPRN